MFRRLSGACQDNPEGPSGTQSFATLASQPQPVPQISNLYLKFFRGPLPHSLLASSALYLQAFLPTGSSQDSALPPLPEVVSPQETRPALSADPGNPVRTLRDRTVRSAYSVAAAPAARAKTFSKQTFRSALLKCARPSLETGTTQHASHLFSDPDPDPGSSVGCLGEFQIAGLWARRWPTRCVDCGVGVCVLSKKGDWWRFIGGSVKLHVVCPLGLKACWHTLPRSLLASRAPHGRDSGFLDALSLVVVSRRER